MNSIIAKALFKGLTYTEYRKLMNDLLLNNKSTGFEQTKKLYDYSVLNETRMKRLDKTMVIKNENVLKIKALKKDYLWLVITEGWCGDAAQTLPIFNKIASLSDNKIELKIVLRDENDSLMNLFLTGKSKSIPILIVVEKETGLFLNFWGPRPNGAKKLLEIYKSNFGSLDEIAKAELQMWYLKDKGISTQDEVIAMMVGLD